jgi:hypothetical protein
MRIYNRFSVRNFFARFHGIPCNFFFFRIVKLQIKLLPRSLLKRYLVSGLVRILSLAVCSAKRYTQRVMHQIFAVALILIFCAASCKPKLSLDALLPPETPLFVKEGVGYGVVNASFAHVLEKPNSVSSSSGLIRKGSIVTVIERRAVPSAGEPSIRLWAFVEARGKEGDPSGSKPVAGWLPGESLDFYENLPKAETASALMPR